MATNRKITLTRLLAAASYPSWPQILLDSANGAADTQTDGENYYLALEELLLAGVLVSGFSRLVDFNFTGSPIFGFCMYNYLNFTIHPKNSLDFNFTVW